jgi:hypothetical protein
LLGQPGNSLDWQCAVPLIRRRLERERDTSPDALRGSLFHPELGRDGIRRPEADATHVLGQSVRVLGHDLNGLIAVGLEDAYCSRRADPVRVKENHDLPHRLLLSPARHNARGTHGPNAGHLGQALWGGLNDLQGVHAKDSDDALGHGWPDTAHLARGKILLDALCPGRRGSLQNFSLELEPMRAVANPQPAGRDPLSGRDRRRMANDRHKVTLATRVDFQDSEAVL